MAGYVYLIGTPVFNWYKIGKSKTPDIRIQNIGILLPFRIEIFGIWKADNCTSLESFLHKQFGNFRINGEWFRFSRKEIGSLFLLLPDRTRIFPSDAGGDSVFRTFANIERDCPENCTILFRIKKMRGNFTPEEREQRKRESIRLQIERKTQKLLDKMKNEFQHNDAG